MKRYVQGFQAAKANLETFYDGTCDVIQYAVLPGVVNQVQEVVTGEAFPCHLNYETVRVVNASEQGAEAVQNIMLFLGPGVPVLPGSKVVVRQNGGQMVFEAAGEAAVYQTHQEVPLKLAKKWA